MDPSTFMKGFFADIPDLDELPPDVVATKYIDYCYSRLYELTSLASPAPSSNVFLMDDRTPLSLATTRSMLVSDATFISHSSGKRHVVAKNFVGTISGSWGTRHFNQLFDDIYVCPDLRELGEWLRAARPLLTEGALFYSPHFDYEGPTDYPSRDNASSIKHLRDALIVSRRILEQLTSKKFIKTGLMKPILALDLPILERLTFPLLRKLR